MDRRGDQPRAAGATPASALTRSGESGSSSASTPSASETAFASAAPAAAVPPSPAPLTPIGLSGDGRVLGDQHIDDRGLARGRQQVVDERAGQQLPVILVGELLQQRPPDALHQSSDDLALDEHRVDRAADVIGDPVAVDLDAAGLAIDLDRGAVQAIGKAHLLGVEVGLLAQAGLRPSAERLRRFRGRRDLGQGEAPVG